MPENKESPGGLTREEIEFLVNSTLISFDDDKNEEEIPRYNSFVAIDFETATNHYSSACSVGLVKVVNKTIAAQEYFLIQPPDNHYFKENTLVHGINASMTKDADTFPVIWAKIQHYFKDSYIVAHNALFDMSVLKACLDYYQIPEPDFWYFDSISISSAFCKGIGRNLEERCKHLGIYLEHHNAMSDAKGCASLVLHALNTKNRDDIGDYIKKNNILKEFCNVSLKKSYNFLHKAPATKASEINNSISEDEKIFDDDFTGKTFVFTGQLEELTRTEAYNIVVKGGGTVKDAVSKKVDYLVNAGDTETTKLRKAKELQEQGHNIQIISEAEFMNMTSN